MLYLIGHNKGVNVGEEWAVHQCADADHYTVDYRKEMTRVAGNPYSTGCDHLYHGGTGIFIKYCPFCGCDIGKDTISTDTLPNRYIHPMWKA